MKNETQFQNFDSHLLLSKSNYIVSSYRDIFCTHRKKINRLTIFFDWKGRGGSEYVNTRTRYRIVGKIIMLGSKRSDSIFIVYTSPSDEEQANGVENERRPTAQLARILKAIGQFA